MHLHVRHMRNVCCRSANRREKNNERNDETNFMLLWLCTICANRGMRQNPKIVCDIENYFRTKPNGFKYLPLIANINSVQCALQHASASASKVRRVEDTHRFAIEMGFRKNTHSQSSLNSQNEQIDATQNKTVRTIVIVKRQLFEKCSIYSDIFFVCFRR